MATFCAQSARGAKRGSPGFRLVRPRKARACHDADQHIEIDHAMSNVLFLASPSHGHVNTTVGLVAELGRRAGRVRYVASEASRERIEATGATFKAYAHDLDMFKGPPAPGQRSVMLDVIARGADTLADIFAKTAYRRFDYLVHSAPFPFAKPVARLLELPRVASHAVFAGLQGLFDRDKA